MRQLSLRARLLVTFIVVAGVGLATCCVFVYQTTEDVLVNQLDARLGGFNLVTARLDSRARIPLDRTPVAAVDPGGSGFGIAGLWLHAPNRPAGFLDRTSTQSPPDLESLDSIPIGEPFDVRSVAGTNPARYRVLASQTVGGALAITALPLNEVDETLDRLWQVQIAAVTICLLLLAIAARWLIGRDLRPLRVVESGAAALATGALSTRLPTAGTSTEAARLGTAFNLMADQIESAFDRERAVQHQLRQFVADASHELRTPLTSMRGYAELSRRAEATDADRARFLMRIEDESKRLASIVDDLLLLSHFDEQRPLHCEPVDVAQLVRDVVADAAAIGADHPVTVDAPRSLQAEVDRGRFTQVLVNLLANARVHTPGGTQIAVALRHVDDSVVLEVADDGPGMSPHVADRIFDRFFRADASRSRAHGGSGLGLAIVAAVVAAHGGVVDVSSSPGQGTVFTVRLPTQRGAHSALPDISHETPNPHPAPSAGSQPTMRA
jgi:two-component system, OmpR family, sensor kinase